MVTIKYKIERVQKAGTTRCLLRVRVALTDLEDLTLLELREATTVPQRTRDRAHMIRLNAQGWNVSCRQNF